MNIHQRVEKTAPGLIKVTLAVAEHMVKEEEARGEWPNPTMAEVQDFLRPMLDKMNEEEHEQFMDLASLSIAMMVNEHIKHQSTAE